jgi:hypothetical protein
LKIDKKLAGAVIAVFFSVPAIAQYALANTDTANTQSTVQNQNMPANGCPTYNLNGGKGSTYNSASGTNSTAAGTSSNAVPGTNPSNLACNSNSGLKSGVMSSNGTAVMPATGTGVLDAYQLNGMSCIRRDAAGLIIKDDQFFFCQRLKWR